METDSKNVKYYIFKVTSLKNRKLYPVYVKAKDRYEAIFMAQLTYSLEYDDAQIEEYF